MKNNENKLTTGLSSPRSESRSASAMAYAGTGSRFFTRILAAVVHGRQSRLGTRHTRSHVAHAHGTRDSKHATAWRRASPRLARCGMANSGNTAPPPRGVAPPRGVRRHGESNRAISNRYFSYYAPPVSLVLFLFQAIK